MTSNPYFSIYLVESRIVFSLSIFYNQVMTLGTPFEHIEREQYDFFNTLRNLSISSDISKTVCRTCYEGNVRPQ